MLLKKQWTFLPKANIEKKQQREDAIVKEQKKLEMVVLVL